MPFNIENAADVIREIRHSNTLKRTRILVGGHVFNQTPDLWQATGADAFAANLRDARQVAAEWERREVP